MSTEQALLAAIWENPHDDLPRLVYADWLEETGDAVQSARAEFIRVQCELAKLDEWDDRRPPLEKREQQLWKKYAKEWKAELPADLRKRGGFRRGFPDPPVRELRIDKFLALTPDDLAAAPLWNFHLLPNIRKLGELVSSPNLLRVGTLDLRSWLEQPEDAAQFVSSAHLRNLAALNVGWSRLGDQGLAEFATATATLPSLRALDLECSDLTDTGVQALAGSPLVGQLQVLKLGSNHIGVAGIEAPFRSPHPAALRDLDLQGVGVPGAGLHDAMAAAIARSAPVFALQKLNLCGNRITAAGAEALAGWPGLASFRVLDLDGNSIGSDGLTALVRSPYLGAIKSLRLFHLNADEQVKALARERFGEAVKFAPG
jgi:uncharacterized protein (TIGR02996 family)